MVKAHCMQWLEFTSRPHLKTVSSALCLRLLFISNISVLEQHWSLYRTECNEKWASKIRIENEKRKCEMRNQGLECRLRNGNAGWEMRMQIEKWECRLINGNTNEKWEYEMRIQNKKWEYEMINKNTEWEMGIRYKKGVLLGLHILHFN